jgi:hypothetical protein
VVLLVPAGSPFGSQAGERCWLWVASFSCAA